MAIIECTIRQKEYAKLLSGIPKEERTKIRDNFSNDYTISIQTLYRWEKEDYFIEYMKELVNEPETYVTGDDDLISQMRKAAEDGDWKASKALIEIFDKRRLIKETTDEDKYILLWYGPYDPDFMDFIKSPDEVKASITIREIDIEHCNYRITWARDHDYIEDGLVIRNEKLKIKQLNKEIEELQVALMDEELEKKALSVAVKER